MFGMNPKPRKWKLTDEDKTMLKELKIKED
jgi:hypothetical protein